MLKPHRILIDKVSGYADEAAAFVRRRRHHRRSFVRIQYQSGKSENIDLESRAGREVVEAAGRLISSDPGKQSSAAG